MKLSEKIQLKKLEICKLYQDIDFKKIDLDKGKYLVNQAINELDNLIIQENVDKRHRIFS